MFTYKNVLFLLCLPVLPLATYAEGFEWSAFGLRIGTDGESKVDVNSYELIATLESPWNWTINDSFEIDLDFEFGVGALDGEGETGFIAHAGPALEFKFADLPFEFVLSTGPALLSEDEFDVLDLGGSFQFLSAVGFNFEITEEWSIGYRYLHISNAGLHDENPGMDLHALNLFFEF